MVRLDKKYEVLIIKPQRITVEDTENVLEAIKIKYPNSSIYLLANLLENDYNKLIKNRNIEKKLFYQPGKNKLSIIPIVKLIFAFWIKRFDIALVLSSLSQAKGYRGFKKAKLIAFLSRAKNIYTYHVD